MARVSSELQVGNLSIPAQLRELREFCGREGWEVVDEVAAEGESASASELSRRPSLVRVMELAESGAMDVVVYHESTRLSRDEELAHWLINRLSRHGVRLVDASKPMVDFSTSDGRFLYSMDAALASWMGRRIGDGIRKAKREQHSRACQSGRCRMHMCGARTVCRWWLRRRGRLSGGCLRCGCRGVRTGRSLTG